MMGPYLESIRSRVGAQCILLPGVRAIILNDRGEVLLQRRTDLKCWGLPSGSVEIDETALEALNREVLEETGLEVRHAEPMALYSGPSQRFKYPNGDEIQCFSVAFVVRDWAGTPKADGVEGSEVRFWPMDALPQGLVEIHRETLADYRDYDGRFLLASDARPSGA
jgi:ADP-ribose pyrophosphatase YjhB (NUDIX family)